MLNENLQMTNPLVLVADDDSSVRLLARAALERAGLAVEEAEDGTQTLCAVDRLRPDLVLLDVMMPDMDGYEVCKRLKTEESTKTIPVIFLTGKIDDEDEARGFKLGAVDYIAKPLRPAIVEARVRTQLELKRQREALESLLEKRTQELEKSHQEYLTLFLREGPAEK